MYGINDLRTKSMRPSLWVSSIPPTATPSQIHSIHIFKRRPSNPRIRILRHHDSNQTRPQHILPIHPRMHIHKQLRPIPTRSFHKLRLATGMERQVRRDIVHFALPTTPRRLAFPPSLGLELAGRDALECADAAQVAAFC